MVTIRLGSYLIATTVLIVALVVVLLLVQFNVVKLVAGLPIFFVMVSVYLTAVGLTTSPNVSMRHTYLLVWGGILLEVGAVWLLVYYGVGVIPAAVVALLLALSYIYLNRIRSGRK